MRDLSLYILFPHFFFVTQLGCINVLINGAFAFSYGTHILGYVVMVNILKVCVQRYILSDLDKDIYDL